MQWWKRLSQSDARQETTGGLMPFRFTKENCPGDFTTWFREDFFGELDWENTAWRDHEREEAAITISVNIMGDDLGQKVMTLTHAEYRHENHNAPATHLDFDPETKKNLQVHNTVGKYIVFSKDLTGNFKLVIQDEAP
jgi:hypothetical protein